MTQHWHYCNQTLGRLLYVENQLILPHSSAGGRVKMHICNAGDQTKDITRASQTLHLCATDLTLKDSSDYGLIAGGIPR